MDEGTGQGDVSIFKTGALDESFSDKLSSRLPDDGYKDNNAPPDYNANIEIKDTTPQVDLLLLPCGICGRTFKPDSLAKHTSICQKTSTKKRKTFDSSRQRREGTDLAQFLPKNFGLPENSPFVEKEKSTPTPKMPVKKHSPRASVPVRANTNGSSKLFATPENSRCPHCGRGFGARAFDRHVAWCAERTRLAIAPGASSGPTEVRVARSRLIARTSYRAPPVKSRRSLTREKYSLSRSASVDSAVSERSSTAGENRRITTDGNTQHLPVIMKTPKHNEQEPLMTRSLTKPRFDDNYDPFLSARRQMLDLMSSSSNIHKLQMDHKKKTAPSYATPHRSHASRDESSINHKQEYSPHFQRSRSLRNPSNKYSYAGKLVNTKLPNKPVTCQLNNGDKLPNKKTNETVKVKNTHSNRLDSQNKSPSVESSPFFNRTEKHRVIKLEPVDNITSSRNKNNNILDNKVYKNDITDSQENFIDPRLINDKVPPSVQKLLDNPVLLSSTESLLCDNNPVQSVDNKNQLNFEDRPTTPSIDDLSAQYDKIMISLEQSMNSQTSLQDEDALYNDLEQLMSSFDEKSPDISSNMYKNTKLQIKDSLDGLSYSKKNNNVAKPKQVPYNKSISLNFSSVLNNPLPNPAYPLYSRSHSVADRHNKDKKLITKMTDQYKENESQLENDIMKSLKDIDLMCDSNKSSKKYGVENAVSTKKKSVTKYKHESSSVFKAREVERKNSTSREHSPPSNYSSKYIGDSAYGSLNRSSPSNHLIFRRSPSHKEASPSSPVAPRQSTPSGDGGSSRHSPIRERDYVSPFNKDADDVIWVEGRLSSSESDASISNMTHSLSRTCSSIISTSRLSKFCHDCGNKFPFETAKFCVECGAKRLTV